jgi:hypothetical protein
MVFTSCSKSQDAVDSKWSSVQYYYSCGPLPPPYQYSFDLSVNGDGTGVLIYRLGNDVNKEPLVYNFTVCPCDLKTLNGKVENSDLLSGKVEAVPENKHPIGGSLERARIIIPNPNPDLDQPPRVIESPYFPTDEYKQNLKELYDFIKTLVPKETWSDVSAKQTEYESNYKK